MGNCDCGKAKTCKCTVGVGNCVATDVTDEVTCTVGTGNCVVGTAKKTTCTVATGNCETKSPIVICGVDTGNCQASKATTSFACVTVSGNCQASGNTGGTVDCTITGAGNCYCGSAKTCGGAVSTGAISCMESTACDCSGLTTGTCCGSDGQITVKAKDTAKVKADACCGTCSVASTKGLSLFVAAVVAVVATSL